MARHLHIDPFSGIAGDMFLGACVDLGVDLDAVRQALAKLPVERPYEITTQRVQRHGIGAVDLKVRLLDEPAAAQAAPADVVGHHKHGHDHSHDHGHSHDHEHSHTHDHSHGHVLPLWKKAVAGLSAGAIGAFVGTPAELAIRA